MLDNYSFYNKNLRGKYCNHFTVPRIPRNKGLSDLKARSEFM